MDIRQRIQVASTTILDVLFPPRCAGCGDPGVTLCSDCVATFVPVIGCAICAQPGEHAQCYRCQTRRPRYERILSAFLFAGPIRDVIHAFKYEGQTHLVEPLADAIAAHIAPPPGLIGAVPLYADRRQMRGYNQAELLADALAERWGRDSLPVGALKRVRATVSQTGLTYAERQANLADAFVATISMNTPIILIDDVCTTGSTIEACADACRRAGAAAIYAVTAARTP